MFSAIKRFFSSAFKRLKKVWNKIIKGAFGYFISQVLEFAQEAVRSLEMADLTNDEKREQAFTDIRNEALRRGLNFKNNWIGIIIGIALAIVREEF